MRFDVYRMPAGGAPGYLVDVQSELVSDLATRIVIPLIANPKLAKPVRGLNPVFEILGQPFTMLTQELAAIQKLALKSPVVSLADQQNDITRALDMLFTGF